MQTVTAVRSLIDLDRPRQGIADIKKAGFENALLDFSVVCPPGLLEGLGKPGFRSSRHTIAAEEPERLGEPLQEFFRQCREAGVRLPIARAPYLEADTKRKDLEEKLQALALESIRLCGKQGSRHLIVRPLPVRKTTEHTEDGTGSGSFGRNAAGSLQEETEKERDFYLSLAQAAGEHQVMILLESRCRDLGGHPVRGPFCDERETAAFLEELNRLSEERYGKWRTPEGRAQGGAAADNYFGFCLDVGTMNLCGRNMHDFALVLGKHLRAVTLRDGDGHDETSLLPYTCVRNGQAQTDWLSLIRGLREADFDGMFLMDYGDTAAVCPTALKPYLLGLAGAQGKYFVWQAGMERMLAKHPARVLFGAGNMCRNYMKNYGEAYPPLFTCDNNRALWGTQFCGLEVKPPEALLELSPGCAVYICNIYYREIEAQLRKMGLKNPVEYFNDEYMPTFYTDRLDAVTREYDGKKQPAEQEGAGCGRQEKHGKSGRGEGAAERWEQGEGRTDGRDRGTDEKCDRR